MISENAHYIIAGYGRIGSKLTEVLLENNVQVTAIDPYIERSDIDIDHPKFSFHQIDGTIPEELESIGMTTVTGIVLVAGTFAANTSILFAVENNFPRETRTYKDVIIAIRARNAEEKEIYLQHAEKSPEKIFVIYSEEAGASAVAAELGILIQKKQKIKLNELELDMSGNGSKHFIELTWYFEQQGIEVLNEHFDYSAKDDSSKYRVVLGEIADNKRKALESKLQSMGEYKLTLLPELSESAEKVMAYSM